MILRGLTLEQALQTAQSLYHAGVRLVEYAYDGREADEQNANVLAGLCERGFVTREEFEQAKARLLGKI